MKVLVSAYACEAGRGSEPGVGLRVVEAAASEHEVWVLTRANNLDNLRRHFAARPERDRVHLVGFEVEGRARRWKKRGGLFTLHWYYDAWQREAARRAVALDRQVGFDVVHHATFATYWTRTGVAAVPKPLVWGPVGGGVSPPLLLMPTLGVRGLVEDLGRMTLRPLVARWTGARSTARRAEVVFVQNPETARRLGVGDRAVVLPNALVVFDEVFPTSTRARGRVMAAGRLIPWKGYPLLFRAMAHLPDEFTLDLFGRGPDEGRLRRLIARLGLESRVRLRGAVPRAQFLRELASASVFVHPALHEEAGFVVAEAVACGVPTVVLDHGGPPVIAAHCDGVPVRAVSCSTPNRTVHMLAEAIRALARHRGDMAPRPRRSFADEILSAFRVAAS